MGNRFSRRRDAPATTEAVAAEQKAAEEPAAAQPAEESAITQTQEATENLDVVVGVQVTPKACLPAEECTSECKEVEATAAPVSDPEPVVKETPAPVQPEPVVIDSEPAPPEPVVEAAPEPVHEPEPAPVPEPEPVVVVDPVPEADPFPEAVVEAEPETIPEPAPAEPMDQQIDLLSQESLPEPVLPSPPLIDFAVPDVTPIPVSPDELAEVPAGEQSQDSAKAAESSASEPEQPVETSESLEKLVAVEAPECLEKLGSDVNEESVCEILKNSELTGSDLVNDLIPSDVKIPDDTPIIDMSTSTELM